MDSGLRRRDFLRRGSGALVLGAGAVLCGACSATKSVQADDGGTLAKIRKQGYVSVGVADEEPFGYVDKHGRLTGEAPALAKIIFRGLGVPRIRPVRVTFESLIPGLQAGRFDTTAAGMSILADRCRKVTFANPEYKTLTAFLVRKGNPEHITRFQDVAKESKTALGVMSGAAEGDYAKKLGVDPARITIFPDPQSGFDGLSSGRIDALALTGFSLRSLLGKHPGAPYEVTEQFAPVINGHPQVSAGGFAFRNADTDLVTAFNQRLEAAKKDGTLLKTLKPFGFTKEEMPGGLTAKQLCDLKM